MVQDAQQAGATGHGAHAAEYPRDKAVVDTVRTISWWPVPDSGNLSYMSANYYTWDDWRSHYWPGKVPLHKWDWKCSIRWENTHGKQG